MTGIRYAATVLGTPDVRGLSRFYSVLLGWPVVQEEPDWVTIGPRGEQVGLSFQTEDDHEPPRWPAGPGDQQMQLHLDLEVDDLDVATARAVELGARLAERQPQEHVRVLLDPPGHPFCLFLPD